METENFISTDERFLRIREVAEISGLSIPQIYVEISKGEFPKQIKLTSGGKIAGWLRSEVLRWVWERVEKGRDNSKLEAGHFRMPQRISDNIVVNTAGEIRD